MEPIKDSAWEPSTEWTNEERLLLIGRITARELTQGRHVINDVLYEMDLIYRLTYASAAFLQGDRQSYQKYFV